MTGRRRDELAPSAARILAAALLVGALDPDDGDGPVLDELPVEALRPVARALLGLAADVLLDQCGGDPQLAAVRAGAIHDEARAEGIVHSSRRVPDDARELDGETP